MLQVSRSPGLQVSRSPGLQISRPSKNLSLGFEKIFPSKRVKLYRNLEWNSKLYCICYFLFFLCSRSPGLQAIQESKSWIWKKFSIQESEVVQKFRIEFKFVLYLFFYFFLCSRSPGLQAIQESKSWIWKIFPIQESEVVQKFRMESKLYCIYFFLFFLYSRSPGLQVSRPPGLQAIQESKSWIWKKISHPRVKLSRNLE